MCFVGPVRSDEIEVKVNRNGAWLERLSGLMFESLTAPDDQLCSPAIKHVATEVDVHWAGCNLA